MKVGDSVQRACCPWLGRFCGGQWNCTTGAKQPGNGICRLYDHLKNK
ncbi:hypothetical protein E1A91_A12G204600v1 [Gossypium mustelinum]|uniref:Uncharacterized protein n=1 Tax=Gossypium mustelinum TaxID=34275 RepID=A0A5D2WWU3_GOSMU|nr:hypothetical protein E1A91_A12G204600v1 [Gossypium mustelinum]